MGFYFELQPRGEGRFTQGSTPGVFWVLYAILGFSLSCMGGAALGLLQDLAASGNAFDRGLYYSFLGMIPIYLLMGLFLAGVRKNVVATQGVLQVCYKFFKLILWSRKLTFSDISAIDLVNKVPGDNVAVRQHGDSQYYLRGHWRVIAELSSGRVITLDKHNEKAALLPLFNMLQTKIST